MDRMMEQLNITLVGEEKSYTDKRLLKAVLSKWLNCGDTILEMCVLHLPSPKQAQKYRAEYLYEGPMDDACGMAMRNCDPKGPLMMFVSKMVPANDSGRFYAFGRVFSGTIRSGQKVRVLGSNYHPGSKTDLK